MSLIRSTAWSAVAALVLTGGRFFVTMLLAKKLGVIEFGKFAFTQWLVDMVFLSLAFGLPGSASRFFAEFRTQSANLLAYERWYLSRAVVVIAAVGVASPMVELALNGEVSLKSAMLQSGWTTATAAWGLLMARAQGLQQFKRVGISNIIFVVAALAGCALLPDEGANVSNAMLVITVSTIAAAFSIWLPLPLSLGRDDQSKPKPNINHQIIWTFGFNLWITSLVGALVWSRGELVVVRAQLGDSDVAIYSIALTLTSIATQGLLLLTGALGPHLAQIWGAGKQELAIQQCRRITDMLTFTAGLSVISLVSFAPELIFYTFGSPYTESKTALVILSLGVLGLTSAAANQLLQIKTNGIFARNTNLFGAISLFASAVPLVMAMGIVGAATSRVVVQISVGIATMYYAQRLIGVKTVNLLNQIKSVAIVFIAMACILQMESQLQYRILIFGIAVSIKIYWLRNDESKPIIMDILKYIYSFTLVGKKFK